MAKLNRPDRFRIYHAANGSGRVLGIITPIENEPACSNAACHAHPASQQILGVLDTNLSLAAADASLAESTRMMLIYTVLAVVIISALTGVFVLRLVHRPVQILKRGTEELAQGDLGYQIDVHSSDELGDLANSFNIMSLQLRAANEEITSWARTLEERVEEKTSELKRAHEHVVQVEKMASIGKMAAVVAHEINNPLSGILTYAKLLKKWVQRVESDEQKRTEIRECLDLVESESRRCGELVKNLLTFSRTAPMNLAWADVSEVVDRSIRLVQHQLDLGNVQLQLESAADLPLVHCDPAQVEQVLLALVMNAIDAMPRGGNLLVRTRSLPQSRQIEIQVRDDGVGIPPDLLPRLFEPFLTTKETGKGVGLGLAISKTIVERHGGVVEVESQPGRGTTFTFFCRWTRSADSPRPPRRARPKALVGKAAEPGPEPADRLTDRARGDHGSQQRQTSDRRRRAQRARFAGQVVPRRRLRDRHRRGRPGGPGTHGRRSLGCWRWWTSRCAAPTASSCSAACARSIRR